MNVFHSWDSLPKRLDFHSSDELMSVFPKIFFVTPSKIKNNKNKINNNNS